MPDDRILWVRPAHVEEGSFCDRGSDIHYNNVSAEQAEEAVDAAESRGDSVADFRDTSGENDRYNCTMTDIDGVGHTYRGFSSIGTKTYDKHLILFVPIKPSWQKWAATLDIPF